MIANLLQDLRTGARSLRRNPGFALLVVLTLALGMGANAGIFSLINATFLRPLAVPDPEALAFFTDSDGGRGGGPLMPMRLPVASHALFKRLQEDSRVHKTWSGLAAQQSGRTVSVVTRAGEASAPVADAQGRSVSANYFEVFGARATRGRTFAADDQTAVGANPVLVLSHRFWQRRFAGDPAIVGERITVNGTQYTVIGVGPPEFTGSTVGWPDDFWVPLTMHQALARPKLRGAGASWLEQPDQWWLVVFGRLAAGISRATAEAGVNLTLRRFLADHPELLRADAKPESVTMRLEPGAQGVASMRKDLRGPFTLLMTGVGLLLLIVCLNVGHLLLARASRREREMSIRAALGATRPRLVRQLLAEGLLLSGLGAALAVVIAPWVAEGLLSFGDDPRGLGLSVRSDLAVLAFTGGLGAATAVILGLVPAWPIARANLAQALRATAAAITASHARRLFSRGLLASQIAFSLVLLVTAGLLAGSLLRLRSIDKGFDEQHLLMLRIDPRITGLDGARARAVPEAVVARLSAVPGVQSASVSTFGLLSGMSWSRSLTLAPGAPASQEVNVSTNAVTPAFFDTVGMRLLRGRVFTAEDREGSQGVVVLNESAERKLFGGAGGLGRRLYRPGKIPEAMEVVGIVADARTQGVSRPAPPMYYQPIGQQQSDFAASLEVRAAGDPAALADAVVRAAREAAPGLALLKVRTMRAQVDGALAMERILATLSGAFGLAALFLVSLGLYAVIGQWAGQRRREIGLRIALGAPATRVRWLVLRQALALVLVGLAVGLPAAFAATRLLGAAVVGLGAAKPAAFAGAALAMFAVATAAAYLPARRASRVDPMVALRAE
jgi:predicted permease